MKANEIIAAITTKVKSDLQNHAEDLNQPLTAENAENVAKLIGNAVLSAAGEGFKTYLLQNEPRENTIIVDGKKYQFNRVCDKEIQSTFGKVVVPRRLYQDADGNSFVPLDRHCIYKSGEGIESVCNGDTGVSCTVGGLGGGIAGNICQEGKAFPWY